MAVTTRFVRLDRKSGLMIKWFRAGGVSEWSMEAVLKTVKPKGFVGSNPTSSAKHDLWIKSWKYRASG